MHNYSLHLLFVKSGMFVTPKYLRSGMAARPKSLESSMTVIPKARPMHLESGMVCQTQSAQVHAKLAHLGLLNLHPGVTTMLNPIVYMSSHWMRSRALFHMVQRVQKNNGWIAVGDRLFVFFLSFLSLDNESVQLSFLFVVCQIKHVYHTQIPWVQHGCHTQGQINAHWVGHGLPNPR